MGTTNSYWGSLGGIGVLSANSLGDRQTPDPTPIPGSSVGAIPPGYADSARKVYPVYDGVTVGMVYKADGTEVGVMLRTLAIDPVDGKIKYERYPSTFWKDENMSKLAGLPPDGVEPADFTNWHSAFQAEYIVRLSEARKESPPNYQIRTGSTLNAWYLLDDNNRPVNVLALTLSDYGKLSDAEKIRFQGALEASKHLKELGLTVSKDDKAAWVGQPKTASAAATGMEQNLDLINTSKLTQSQKNLFTTQIRMLIAEVGSTQADGLPAVNLDRLTAEANKIMGRFKVVDAFVSAVRPEQIEHTAMINAQVMRFFDFDESDQLHGKFAVGFGLVTKGANSLDGGKTMDKGIEEFLAAERNILSAKERRLAISGNSAYRDPQLDVPNLIYQLQLLYEGESKSVADAGTEEFRQLHKLLSDYNVMQQMLSQTIAEFDTSKSDDKRRFMNLGVKPDGKVDDKQTWSTTETDVVGEASDQEVDYKEWYESDLWINLSVIPRYHWSLLANYDDEVRKLHTDFINALKAKTAIVGSQHEGNITGVLDRRQMAAFSMFADEAIFSPGKREHPLEKLYGAPRPDLNLIDETETGGGSLQLKTKNFFDQLQTSMSNTITILNQQNQLKQNEVENATKEQNRHFELGNNALRKMNDLLLMIGRG